MTKKISYLIIISLFFIVAKTKAQSIGGTTSGSASYCSGNNSGFLSLTGYVGTILFWQTSTNGGASWVNESNIATTQSYLNLTQTTHFRAVVQDGSFPADTSTVSVVTIFTPSDGGTITGAGAFCQSSGTGVLNLSGNVGNVVNWLVSTDNGTTWTSIANTTTTLNHPNITQNTMYMAVVENEPTCPRDSSAAASFVINPLTIAGTLSSSDTVCFKLNEDTLTLSGYVGNVVFWEFSTNNGASWTTISNTNDWYVYNNLDSTTEYRVSVKSGVCNTETSNLATIQVQLPLAVDAGEDVNIIQFQSTTLTGSGMGNPVWFPTVGLTNSSSITTSASPEVTTTYYLTVTDAYSCVGTDSVTINVSIPIPNTITPNGDRVNDFFVIKEIENFPSNSFQVFNRFGNVVFKSSPYNNTFNGVSSSGGNLTDGIYYYQLDFGKGDTPTKGYILIKR